MEILKRADQIALGECGRHLDQLNKQGGIMYRGSSGRFIPNPNKGKSWYCQKSPTGAHHWMITAHEGRCKYCRAVQEVPTSAPGVYMWRSREV